MCRTDNLTMFKSRVPLVVDPNDHYSFTSHAGPYLVAEVHDDDSLVCDQQGAFLFGVLEEL
jgi:hypothetical protein